MGCVQTKVKKESGDFHPNVFRVVNIDENGTDLWSGQLEVTDSNLILYREGRDSTVWPLVSLRRYGFDGELFSFESGRRCATGEGIYAFKCRRASMLFRTLQENIHMRNAIHDTLPFQFPNDLFSNSRSQANSVRQTLQASVVHRSSVDSGRNQLLHTYNNLSMQPMAQSPRSPSNVDNFEVMQLYPQAQSSNAHVGNVYQVKDFKPKEHNNNHNTGNSTSEGTHSYTNDISKDLAVLRNMLQKETAKNTMKELEDANVILNKKNKTKVQESNGLLSPTLSNNSEPYAQLSLEQEAPSRLYVNIPTDLNEIIPNDVFSTTPLLNKQVEYYNVKPEVSYTNLSLGKFKNDNNQKLSESDTFASLSPVEELEVNYAILELETNKDVKKIIKDSSSPDSQSYSSSRLESVSQSSNMTRAHHSVGSSDRAHSSTVNQPTSVGYTTIDMDKTIALTSLTVAQSDETEESRRIRHSSTCSVPESGSGFRKLLSPLTPL